MKKMSLLLLAPFTFFSIALVSCSHPAIPPAFERIVVGSSPGNPNAEIILNADYPDVPDSMAVFGVDQSLFNDSDAANIARKLGFAGGLAPLRAREKRIVYSYSADAGLLEIYPDGRMQLYGAPNTSNTPGELPSDEECIVAARAWMDNFGFPLDAVGRVTVAVNKTVAIANTETNTISEDIVLSKRVKFFTVIDGFEVDTPNASVVVAAGGIITDVSTNTWHLDKYGHCDLKTPLDSFEILKRYVTSPEYSPTEAAECLTNLRGFERLVISGISLRYSTTPGGELMRPLYIFEGLAFAASFPEGEKFVGKVDAIAY